MTATRTPASPASIAGGIGAAFAGLGILTLALFPLAIPMLVLTAVFVAPLALVGIVPVLAAGIVAGVVLAMQAVGRRLARLRPRTAPRPAPASWRPRPRGSSEAPR